MSEPSAWSRPDWPVDLPGPGSGAWPQSAVDWLNEHVPTNRWRHRYLAGDPWLYSISAVTVVRGQLEQLRTEYRTTANQWAKQLPAQGSRALIKATEREGRRLAALLDHVRAIEDALMADRMRPGVRPKP